MPSIDELSEVDAVEVADDEAVEISDDLDSSRTDTDNTYNFAQTTILVGLQILPVTSESERQVIISAGIRGEPPVISSTTLEEILQVKVFADILSKLEQALPQLEAAAKLKKEKQNTYPQKRQKQTLPIPELPTSSPTPKPTNQLTLF